MIIPALKGHVEEFMNFSYNRYTYFCIISEFFFFMKMVLVQNWIYFLFFLLF